MKFAILHILCEGQTEERFVRDVLAPYLQQFNIYPKPILLLTSRKKNARGGMVSYSQAKHDLNLLRKQYADNGSEHHVFTTMFDYYALPDDFPAFRQAAKINNAHERVEFLERKFAEDMNINSFVPYIQLHEFEALLFSDISKLEYDYPRSHNEIMQLNKEAATFANPELINNSPETAPSKRIIKTLSDKYNYNKVQSGAAVAALIGIDVILARCQHFREWTEQLRSVCGN
ncbi:MAG: DUF4276 family protein [Muribaculaceae bacterium]|nr:DUF4276 family protein [Muribaculaceae bacterium]